MDLGYFDKDIVLHSFLQDKKFYNFVFSFICMIYKWGGEFIGGNFPRGQFSRGQITGGGGIFIGENIHRGQFSRGKCSGG